MRHSASPRSISAMRKEKRPARSAVRRLQRATSRRGPSVSAAPLLMGCILGTHGPYVYPQASPPDPLSTSWRGGTQGKILSLVPPLRIAERGTGGEDQVYAQAPRLVGPRRARSAVAQDARSVPRARLRVHAAADAGEPGGGVLSEIPGAVSRSRDAGERAAPGGPRSLGRLGLLRARAESPLLGERRYTTPRRHVAK